MSAVPARSTPVPGPAAAWPLSRRLRAATADWHRRAERAGLMPQLLHGHFDLGTYAAWLRSLHPIYEALEEGLAGPGAAAFAPAVDPSLYRGGALARDLAALWGADWRSRPPAPAAAAYGERLRDLATSAPHRLLAHAYVRYLGDLSGGRILARVVANTLGAATPMDFFELGPAPAVAERAARLRAGLDGAPLDPAGCDEVVDEACRAFAAHLVLFDELAVQCAGRPAGLRASHGSARQRP